MDSTPAVSGPRMRLHYCTYLFVYGTLLPGLAPPAMRRSRGSHSARRAGGVRGRLFDLGAISGAGARSRRPGPSTATLEVPDDPRLLAPDRRVRGYDANDPARSLFRRVPCRAELAGRVRSIDCWVYVYNGDLADATAGGRRRGRPHRGERPHGKETRPVTSPPADYRRRRSTILRAPRPTTNSRMITPRASNAPAGCRSAIPYKTDLALVPEIVDALDGVLFTGGNDLDPALYGEAWHPKAEHDRPRPPAIRAGPARRGRAPPTTPALGVCLGSQLMNVYRGGSLTSSCRNGPPGAMEHRKLDDRGPPARDPHRAGIRSSAERSASRRSSPTPATSKRSKASAAGCA